MRNTIALVAVLGLISGLVGAFAYDQLGGGAGAAPPPPAPTQVREQNLDGSGFIRVHEQGTTVVSGTVNVGNLPSSAGRLIDLGTLTVTAGNGHYPYPSFVDVSDCAKLTVAATLVSPEPNAVIFLSLHGSLDGGVHAFVAPTSFFTGSSPTRSAAAALSDVVFTDLQTVVTLNNSLGSGTSEITASVWCEP